MSREAAKEKPADVGTTLAHERTDMALTRTRMAADRTLMAWIRTSLSMISFGFSILKFFQFLQESGTRVGMFKGERAGHFGLALISLGTVILVPAILEHWGLMKSLRSLDGKSPWSVALVVAILVGGLGVFAFLSGVFNWFF